MNIFAPTKPVCILGLGLIGGSLLRDLVDKGVTAYGYSRPSSGSRAARKEGFDVQEDLIEVLQRANEDEALIVIAVPMDTVAGMLDEIAAHAPNCGITDVVSVKGPVAALVDERGLTDRYVGGHPMAGTEHSGWKNSFTGLFNHAAWVVTYDFAISQMEEHGSVDKQWTEWFSTVVRMIALVGAEAVPVRVKQHDSAVARISHLPHIIAESLSIVGDNGGTLAQSLAAGSFKDATRVAATSPGLVRNMCETNAPALVEVLDEYIDILQKARVALDQPEPDISELVDAGYRTRLRLEARTGARGESVSPVKISSRPVLRLHPGAPNWVTQLRQSEDLGGRVEIF